MLFINMSYFLFWKMWSQSNKSYVTDKRYGWIQKRSQSSVNWTPVSRRTMNYGNRNIQHSHSFSLGMCSSLHSSHFLWWMFSMSPGKAPSHPSASASQESCTRSTSPILMVSCSFWISTLCMIKLSERAGGRIREAGQKAWHGPSVYKLNWWV